GLQARLHHGPGPGAGQLLDQRAAAGCGRATHRPLARGHASAGAGGGAAVLHRTNPQHRPAVARSGRGRCEGGREMIRTTRHPMTLALGTVSALCTFFALVAWSPGAQAAIPIEHWTHASGARIYLVSSPG